MQCSVAAASVPRRLYGAEASPRTWAHNSSTALSLAPGGASMEEQKESLQKIVTTLALKNEEIQNFICCMKQSLQNLEANSTRVQEDLESEFTSLHAVLDELKEGMVTRIKQERASRTYELQNQLSACTKALESSEELLELANQTLCSTETDGFSQAAKDIKDSVTMAPAFRLSLKAKASDNMSHLMVDFTQEREMLQAIKFLPVPPTPEIQASECQVCDNSITVVWTLPEPDSKIDHYDLEYRRINHEGPPRAREDYPWMVVEGIKESEFTLIPTPVVPTPVVPTPVVPTPVVHTPVVIPHPVVPTPVVPTPVVPTPVVPTPVVHTPVVHTPVVIIVPTYTKYPFTGSSKIQQCTVLFNVILTCVCLCVSVCVCVSVFVCISAGLRFDTRYMTFRVKACNKAVAGEFSELVTLETHAFVFKLDSGSSHQNLKVEDLSVEWDSSGGKVPVQDIRKEKNRTNSPMHSPARSAMMSPKRAPSARVGRDRFTAESYTVLADTMIDAGQQYWEVKFDKESKAFAAGVALRSLGRFDQLGKSNASWCIHLNNWLQQSLTAKHNNKARTLDCTIPDRIGIYCNYEEGTLSFYNAKTKTLMHTFRTKFQQPVIPAFMVWNGSFSVQTGLQVPTIVQSGQKRNSNTSSSNASLT
uniref:Fibronectin type III and SPRY domain-containing protein 1 n=1 Tax=Astyanax mexicanus TaxID=7994 RepID=A0A8B9HU81_ASTMX